MAADASLRTGTAAGTVLSLVPHINSEDIVRTILLGIVGATASFIASVILKRFTKLRKK